MPFLKLKAAGKRHVSQLDLAATGPHRLQTKDKEKRGSALHP